ncbi:carboxypeptidase-like regulatory domain-containing protein [Flammeovirga yaeyamensis]|uniref:Carboxypeptidase-like regulatory domain-containing protein n=1 Tax=Flammeovirga yaeyamensis TaxID=367791 RepID=A0AAX1ND87_9BACT|nr:carboxypeptidase-like regulatory domain-containing protein [Flammeovirga yaeyamensis]MBB3696507.1 hypothetical protein [Flammeovirga yaeyamensis]NMF33187.1 carboxypeptidase regulatory-like domain-containing protein [Flammeovirga yaeyamensis]QWG05533.1 carboxypeptidase-like regulatory domain-containing protein [Flammeovirga yaeyamensis]
MKYLLIVFISALLFISCSTSKRRIHQNSIVIEKLGMMRTQNVLISGKIKNNKTIEATKITLTSTKNTYSEFCNKNGEFSFEYISPAKYELNIEIGGFTQSYDSIEFFPGQILEIVVDLNNNESSITLNK